MSEPRSAPTVLQMVLGRRLLQLRQASGLSAQEVGTRLRQSHTTITRMERAEVALKWLTVKALLEIYGVVEEEAGEFLELTEKANVSGWWQGYRDVLPSWFGVHVSLESGARRIRAYEPHVVPGLLQTPEYARCVLSLGLPRSAPEVVERQIELRRERQALLTRTDPEPPQFWAIVDETVLRRPVGPTEVLRAQLEHLLDVAELPSVTLQVAPFAAGLHPGGFGPFSVFRFEIPELPDVVGIDGLSRATYSEDPVEVALYREVLDQMSTHALSRKDTLRFLDVTRKELDP
ncbi:helix-turn-helix domain-containing protein [Streptomyces sp. NPDC017979]|uniref:helix-turn-helix domain-containing protein n=1 Tax=Streptomyces sp. NPDC017979 TaxID=3365024 RepID=UPI0037B23CCC